MRYHIHKVCVYCRVARQSLEREILVPHMIPGALVRPRVVSLINVEAVGDSAMHAMCSRHCRKSTWGTEVVTQQYWPAFCVTLGPRERTKVPISEGACTRTSTPLTVIKRHIGHCSTNDSPSLGPPLVEDGDRTINRTAARSQLAPRFPIPPRCIKLSGCSTLCFGICGPG